MQPFRRVHINEFEERFARIVDEIFHGDLVIRAGIGHEFPKMLAASWFDLFKFGNNFFGFIGDINKVIFPKNHTVTG